MKLIDIRDFEKVYKNQKISHKNITINNRVTLIKGKNGKGKSTLLRGLLGLIHYKGSIIHELDFAYMPEEMRIPYHLKVNTYLELMLPRNSYLEKDRLLKLFNMTKHKDKEIHDLSKGMYLKTRLIYTLSLEKDMYILDEPFNGLDKISTEILKTYILDSKKSFLISSHLPIFNSDSIEVIEL